MTPDRINSILKFLRGSEKLKDTLRSAHTSAGRPESVAEHSWHLCLMLLLFEKEFGDIDFCKTIKLCIIHDLGEAISGDIPAIYQDPNIDKSEDERKDFIELCEPLPDDLKAEMLDLWDEYNQAQTLEAKIAKGLDKLETIYQHLIGKNADNFDYEFNLSYGQERTQAHPVLKEIRDIIDQQTSEKIRQQK